MLQNTKNALSISNIIKTMSLSSGLYKRSLFSRYPYMFHPDQLEVLMTWLRRTRHVPGCYVEIGCAFGSTTIFLKKYMDRANIKRRCVAIDTFSGFIKEHAEHDIRNLKMDPRILKIFSRNKREWFLESLRVDDVHDVEVVEGDAVAFDYSSISPIAYCLLDVDLYKPISEILPHVYDLLSPGGIVIVDDCAPSRQWEGALVAYEEFVSARNLPSRIAAGKLGLVQRGEGSGVGSVLVDGGDVEEAETEARVARVGRIEA